MHNSEYNNNIKSDNETYNSDKDLDKDLEYIKFKILLGV